MTPKLLLLAKATPIGMPWRRGQFCPFNRNVNVNFVFWGGTLKDWVPRLRPYLNFFFHVLFKRILKDWVPARTYERGQSSVWLRFWPNGVIKTIDSSFSDFWTPACALRHFGVQLLQPHYFVKFFFFYIYFLRKEIWLIKNIRYFYSYNTFELFMKNYTVKCKIYHKKIAHGTFKMVCPNFCGNSFMSFKWYDG